MKSPRLFAVGAAFFVLTSWVSACYVGGEEIATVSPAPVTSPVSTHTPEAGVLSADGGLPCAVADLLATKCVSCHGATPLAPMPLVTYDDLAAPSKGDPSISVARASLARMRDTKNPMPPGAPLGDSEIAAFETWVLAGAASSACSTELPASLAPNRPDAAGAECSFASDCPGSLVCKSGVCDLECITDKDCAATWSCEETRCHPPEGTTEVPDAGAPVTYGSFTSSKGWSPYYVASAASVSYSGTVFDGRYVYFAPDGTSGTTLRYDTKSTFASVRSWASFELTGLNPAAKGYRGVVFDGRYVYFVPLAAAPIARFDTRGSYLDPDAWSFFTLSTLHSSVGFTGATFDGRYLYLVPAWGGAAVSFRYDTLGAFTSASSWSVFSIATANANARSFAGAVFDGRHVYFVPISNATGPQGLLARYDTEGLFTAKSSWTTLDLAAFDPKAVGFRTGAFDGRYLYLVPGWTAPSPAWSTSTLARFDIQGAFDKKDAWSFFDTTSVDPGAAGFNGAAFDGRYLILSAGYNGTYDGKSLRYDTHAALGTTSAWSMFDTETLGVSATSFRGMAFDGHYVYFAPRYGVALRFDARTGPLPASATPSGGSFY